MKEKLYFIDFIKGLSIVAVILLHNLPYSYLPYLISIAWIGQAVPVFLLISGYLTYYSFENGKTSFAYYSTISVKKFINRIFTPFIMMTLMLFIIFIIINKPYQFSSIIESGGIGPGSYYPWLYLQAWIFTPLIIYLIDNTSTRSSFIIIILINIIIEVFCSFINIDPNIYRLFFSRYIYVIYLGCFLRKFKLKISLSWILLGMLSLFFSLFFVYTNINLEPFFINQWRGYHWLTAFYPAFLFLSLTELHGRINKSKLVAFFEILGKYSYEIFLCQMFIFSLIPPSSFNFISNIFLQRILYIIITLILSVTPILFYKTYLKKRLFGE